MKRCLTGFMCVLLIFSLTAGAMADEAAMGRPATEYFYEGMYDNFEEEGAAVPTAATAEGLTLSAASAVLMEVSTGQILYEKNADDPRPPASITKIMTLLLTMEAMENGRLLLTDTVTADAHACSMGGSQIWLKEGEQMSVEELLRAVCVASANDAAVALGEHIAGSEEAFVAQMNERAAALGMEHTHFVNCCGLDADGHLSTARDVAFMSRELLRHRLITRYTTRWTDSLRGGATQLVNTNKLVRFYKNTTGLKTGTTSKAGYCVAASAEKDGMELLAVVLGGETSEKRFSDAKAMLNFGFANYELAAVEPSNVSLPAVTVTRGVQDRMTVTAMPAGPFLVTKGQAEQIKPQVVLPATMEAPLAEGQVVGRIRYTLEGETVGESLLVCKAPVNRRTFATALWLWIRRLAS